MIPQAWRRGEVAVIGLGKSGTAAAGWLVGQGITVYASDAADRPALRASTAALQHERLSIELGRHDLDRIRRASVVVVSPGVPPDAPPIVAAREAGRPIVAELDLAARALDHSRLIVVTGTNGKTTTTALIAHLLQSAGIGTAAAGNIGRPLIELATDEDPPAWIVVEASSFQLHDSPTLSPAVGVLTNLAPDHLDRYPNQAAYYADKQLLFRNATGASTWVLNGDERDVLALAAGAAGHRLLFSLTQRVDAWLDRERGVLMVGTKALLPRTDFALLGDHNVANALAAVLAAGIAQITFDQLIVGLRSFRAPPHRLEPVGEVGGVQFVNDSKATNVAAATRAVAAIVSPFVLIVGGRQKGESFGALAAALPRRCRAVVAYGEARDQLAAALGQLPVYPVAGFDDAVQQATRLARPGDVVLLAPACASYDQFQNFEERGERFRALVSELCHA